MVVPLEKRLKKRLQVEIGLLQDELVDIVYNVDSFAVLHGGTAVWRCYNGNRFSEDLDFYVSKSNGFQDKFFVAVKQRGLNLLKFKKTANLFFAKVSNGSVEVRLELNFSAKKNGTVRPFERIDGSVLSVLALSPEALVLEKILAFKNRMFARDLFDIFHLVRLVEKPEKIRKELRAFLETIKKPVDEKNLKAIVFSGVVPSFEQMVESLKRVR